MNSTLDHDLLDSALRRAGSSWDAAAAHGLVSGKLAVLGAGAGPEWLAQVLEGTDALNALRKECEQILRELFQMTHRQFAERLSQFEPLLPDDSEDASRRTEALAHWCEAYLHGLVSVRQDAPVRQQLAAEPVAGIINDLLAISQATIDEEGADDTDEDAYVEVVEYVRVAAQIVYEELADRRSQVNA